MNPNSTEWAVAAVAGLWIVMGIVAYMLRTKR